MPTKLYIFEGRAVDATTVELEYAPHFIRTK
jgi:hypothetical protein